MLLPEFTYNIDCITLEGLLYSNIREHDGKIKLCFALAISFLDILSVYIFVKKQNYLEPLE
jgi:hypothetical protein